MPHLIEKHEDADSAKRAAKSQPPFGPGFPDEIIEKIARFEVWGSDFKDPGDDWCEFRAFDADGNKVGERRVAGY